MATPLSADRMVGVLRAEGVRVVERRSWRAHNRNQKGSWGGVNGVMIHHTAGTGSGMVDFCYNGTSALPGPLCHAVATKDGETHLVGHGRANHAGSIARNAHDAVIAEASQHPRPDSAEPVDGNQHYYGLEIVNKGDGNDPYPDGQYGQAVRWAAAICRAHGWNEHSVIGHGEATRRKIDPSFDMGRFRSAVGERLSGDANSNPEEDDMQLDDKVKLNDWIPRRWPDDQGLQDGSILVNTALASGYAHSRRAAEGVERMERELSAMHATIRTLAEALADQDSSLDSDALVERVERAIENAG